jgi:membrane-associated phospholipid phosphatase
VRARTFCPTPNSPFSDSTVTDPSDVELRALAATLFAVILVGGVCFLLLPVELAFPPTPECGPWDGLVRFAKAVALTNNMLPSLHVALSVACAAVCSPYAGALGRMILWSWASVVAVSTLLLHQHYLIDVLTGASLGAAGVRWVILAAAFHASWSSRFASGLYATPW